MGCDHVSWPLCNSQPSVLDGEKGMNTLAVNLINLDILREGLLDKHLPY